MNDKKRNWLRVARAELGLTQEEAADLCGISRQSYSAYENGRQNPHATTAKRVAEKMGFEVSLWHTEG